MDLLYNYGLFLAKFLTFITFIAGIIAIFFNGMIRKRHGNGQLQLINIDNEYHKMKEDIQLATMNPQSQKNWLKKHKKEEKLKIKNEKHNAKLGVIKSEKPTLYIIEFKGSIDASEIRSLREEISAILVAAKKGDEVLLRLESSGGIVNGYGLAASQLHRLRDAGLYLTVVVDKIAASGGYMMACVANRIIAAPFSIIGSIGVVGQIPNFNRLLKRSNVDIELHTAGKYKRTLTMFGENTDSGREKFCQDLNETYNLFKIFIHKMRPSLDLEKVATGEYWYGIKALDLGLVDEINTSDTLIIKQMEHFTLLGVRYLYKRKIVDCIAQSIIQIIEKIFFKICHYNG